MAYTMKIKWTKDHIISSTTNFSRTVLYAIAVGMLLWLTISSRSLSGCAAVLAVFVLSVGLGYALEKLASRKRQLEWIVLGVCCTLFWLICMWWVSVVPYAMEGDQAIVWQAAELATRNDFIMLSHGGQMFIYPQQQGLAFL